MRADPDRQEELEEVSGSGRTSSFEDRPRARPCSPASPCSNATPLLTASLNAPLQSFYSGGPVRVKCPTDLHVTLTKKSKVEASGEQAGGSQAVFYSTLLKQLRQKAGDVGPTGSQLGNSPVQKPKKEKSGKALPYQCPACKKRFQRPIAMNSHIQNEHISPASSTGERTCRLCGMVSASLAAVRVHLLSSHSIDLDNPAMYLIEERRYSVLEASLRSGREEEDTPSCSNLDMSGSSASCSPAHTPSSSESPERNSQAANLTSRPEDDEMQVEDLSVRRPCPSPQLASRPQALGRYSPQPPLSPRAESPKQSAKRPRVRDSSPSPTFSSSSTVSSPSSCNFHKSVHTCTHCNIVYPNQTLYFLHKGFHSEGNPWRCNSCGHQSSDLYDFNTHLFSVAHQ